MGDVGRPAAVGVSVGAQAGAEFRLSENAYTVLKRRYLRKGPDGEAVETVEQMFHRVASHVAAVEAAWNSDAAATEARFYDLLARLRFLPNSPTFMGAGTPLGQLAACFVLPVSDDMGRQADGIFQTLRNAALIQQTGGGTGFAFSRPRHRAGGLYAGVRRGLEHRQPGRGQARREHGGVAGGPPRRARLHRLQVKRARGHQL